MLLPSCPEYCREINFSVLAGKLHSIPPLGLHLVRTNLVVALICDAFEYEY